MPPIFKADNGELKTIVNVPGWVNGFAAGGQAQNGVRAYNASAWAARAVQMRAEAVASAPIVLEDADGEQIEEHPLLDLLDQVNAEWNGPDLLRYIEAAYCVYGAAYIEKVRGGRSGAPSELFFLNPSMTRVETDPRAPSGIVGFRFQTTGRNILFPREDVIYFRGVYDPLSDVTGQAPLRWALQAAGGDLSAETFLSDFFANSAIPALLLSTENQLQDVEVERVSAWWQRLFRGLGKQHRTGIVGAGLKPFVLGVDPSKLALTEVRAALHQTISTALGVPELLLSPTNAADLTPVEVARRLFYESTIQPRWVSIAAVLNTELLPDYPDLTARRANLRFAYEDLPAFREDADALTTRLVSQVQAGIITAATAARELGYAPEDVPAEAQPPAPAPVAMDILPTVPRIDAPPMSARAALDLERWQRKALRSLLAGKTAAVEFTSDAIGAGDYARIAGALEQAATADDVRAAFSAPMDPALVLAGEIKAARQALEAAPPAVTVNLQVPSGETAGTAR